MEGLKAIEHRQKIAIISLTHHHSIFLEHLSHLFKKDDFSVAIYSKREFYGKMENEKKIFFKDHKWIFVEDGLIRNHEKFLGELNKADLVIIPTLRSDYDFFLKMKLDPPVVLCIHNINYWLCPQKCLPFWKAPGLRQKIWHLRNRRHNIMDQKKRMRILKNVDALNFHNPNMDVYFRNVPKHSGLDKDIKLTHLPFTYYIPVNFTEEHETTPGSSIILGILGQIVENRKDYGEILNALRMARKRFEKPIEIHFIGRFDCSALYREHLLHEFRKIESSNIKVVFHGETLEDRNIVDDVRFNALVQECNVLLSAMRDGGLKMFKGYPERFGQSAASGLSFDAIRFLKPVFIHETHEYIDDIKPAIHIYRTVNDLAELILKCQNPKFIKESQIKIRKVAQKYTREEILQRFWKDLHFGFEER